MDRETDMKRVMDNETDMKNVIDRESRIRKERVLNVEKDVKIERFEWRERYEKRVCCRGRKR